MLALSPCPNCHRGVIDAAGPDGTRIRLQPRAYNRGPVAARRDGGTWLARYLPLTTPLADGEKRYSLHDTRCPGADGGRAEWQRAEVTARHVQRARRGRYPRRRPAYQAGQNRIPPRRTE